ncbi:FtsX-like permease family protein [Actinoplanes sp. CA-015351]|uniref:FtsX-like permease family protein n=1 Tax=Actinoplanes sp. CA-015351 TaxID=3239897 RepID=UPI003D97BB18
MTGVTLSLATQLATGSRRSRRRLSLTAAGIAVAAVFLLAGASALPLNGARNDRLGDRLATLERGAPRAEGTLLAWTWDDLYLGHRVAVTEVAVLRAGAEVAPGLPRLPAPGEIVVSPAVADALAADELLAQRYPQRVAGTVGDAGLLGPGEWVVWLGATPDAFPADHPVASGWGAIPDDVPPVPGALRLAVPIGMVALLLPVLALVVNAVRWGSQERDRRLAALRLSGLSIGQVRLITALETGLAAGLGALLSGGLFLVVRAFAAPAIPVDGGAFAADLDPGFAAASAILAGLPVVATVIAVLALRAVVVNPLGVVRRLPATRLRWWRLVPLAAGLVALAGVGLWSSAFLLIVAAALLMLGLYVAAPALGLGAAALLIRFEANPMLLLAARRAQASVGSAARVTGVVTLLVFAAGWFLSVLPLTNPGNAVSLDELRHRVKPHTFVVSVPAAGAGRAAMPPAVSGLAELTVVQLRSPAVPDGISAVAADCAALAGVLRAPLPDCSPAVAYAFDSSPGEENPLGAAGSFTAYLDGPETAAGVQIIDAGPVRIDTVRPGALDGFDELAVGAGLVPVAQVPARALAEAPARMLLVSTSTDDPRELERVRTALQSLQQGSLREARDVEELQAQAEAVGRGYRAVVWGALNLAIMVSAMSLAVALLDRLIEERRGIASLRAQGVTVPSLRVVMLVQTLMTMLPGAVAGLLCSVPLTLVFFAVSGHPELGLSVPVLAGTAAACGVATLLVVALLLPALDEAIDTRQLVVD